MIRALASLAVHVASGDVMADRVFSVRYLGDSKALGRVRRRIESLLGPLDRLGIREAGALLQIGGLGAIRVRGESVSATRLDLASLDPYLGLPRDALADGRLEVELADAGLVVIENFACFEAFCRGEVEQPLRSTVAWTAGYPGAPGAPVVLLREKRLYTFFDLTQADRELSALLTPRRSDQTLCRIGATTRTAGAGS